MAVERAGGGCGVGVAYLAQGSEDAEGDVPAVDEAEDVPWPRVLRLLGDGQPVAVDVVLVLLDHGAKTGGREWGAGDQAAFARMRAIETGRGVVNVSTTGTSQAFAPDLWDRTFGRPDTVGAEVVTAFTGPTFAASAPEAWLDAPVSAAS